MTIDGFKTALKLSDQSSKAVRPGRKRKISKPYALPQFSRSDLSEKFGEPEILTESHRLVLGWKAEDGAAVIVAPPGQDNFITDGELYFVPDVPSSLKLIGLVNILDICLDHPPLSRKH